MGCEMCGSEKPLFICEIEGTRLNVCSECAKYGKTIKKAPVIETAKEKTKAIKKELENKEEKTEPLLVINPDYAKLIKTAREKLGLNQEDTAKKINEKISVLHNLETGKHPPNIELAKKLERFFHIRLIQEISDKVEWKSGASRDQLTVGDLLKP